MTSKSCLRCDWQGETKEPKCPHCGVQPLYVVGPAGVAASHTPPPLSHPSPPPTGAVVSSGRSARSGVAFVMASLVLTVTLGTWFKAHEETLDPGGIERRHRARDLAGGGLAHLFSDAASQSPAEARTRRTRRSHSDAGRQRTHRYLRSPITNGCSTDANGRGHRVLVQRTPILGGWPDQGSGRRWLPTGPSAHQQEHQGTTGRRRRHLLDGRGRGPRAEPCGDWFDPAVDNVADLAAAVATAPGTELVWTLGCHRRRVPRASAWSHRSEEASCDPGFFYRVAQRVLGSVLDGDDRGRHD